MRARQGCLALISHPSLTAVGLGNPVPAKDITETLSTKQRLPSWHRGTVRRLKRSMEQSPSVPRWSVVGCRGGSPRHRPQARRGSDSRTSRPQPLPLRIPHWASCQAGPPELSAPWRHHGRRRGQLTIFQASRNVVLCAEWPSADIVSIRSNAESGAGMRRHNSADYEDSHHLG